MNDNVREADLIAGMISFRDYLVGRRQAFTAQGAFVQYAVKDGEFPDIESWPQLQSYLLQKGVSPPTVIAAEAVWQSYLKVARRSAASAVASYCDYPG
jgi:hypothetical protein